MHCPTLKDLPSPPPDKTGWPWTEESLKVPNKTPDGHPWPKVSIVTPSYNQGPFIEECIRSILLQGYPDFEYIIIDGGSSDGSVEVIKKYETWLTYWVSEPDRGQSHAINKGLERSTGQLFNWHNSDDVLAPNSLATMAAAMVKYPQAGYIHGDRISIDDRGITQGDNKHSDSDKISFLPELTTAISTLQSGCQPGCLMDRELAVKVGMVDENLHYIMDVDILLRIALIKPPIYINLPANYVRIHPAIKSLKWNSQRAKERINIANKIFSNQDLPDSIRKLRKQTLVTAHQFAWLCYAKAKIYRFFLWHLLLDIFYSSGRGWRKRLNILHHLPKFGKK